MYAQSCRPTTRRILPWASKRHHGRTLLGSHHYRPFRRFSSTLIGYPICGRITDLGQQCVFLGRLPLAAPLVGSYPWILDPCPLCNTPAADIVHLLSACPATRCFFAEWWDVTGLAVIGSSHPWSWFQKAAFERRLCKNLDHSRARFIFVGRYVEVASNKLASYEQDANVDDFIASARQVKTNRCT